jgi:predicted TIM-barrel fold metal-dependent hydrolase
MSAIAWEEICRAAAARTFAGRLDLPSTQLAQMDAEGIDAAVLYPTFALLIEGIDTLKPALAAAYVRAYNHWLAEFCSFAPNRLFGMGLISVHNPDAMVQEVGFVAAQGFRGVVLRPNPVERRGLSDVAFVPFWTECERRSLAVVLHEGTHAYLPSAGAERFDTRFAQHACSHTMEQMIALLDLIEGGVFERHPRLRVAFVEAGCGWVPYWLWRLDAEYSHLAREVETRVRSTPSSYFRRQGWVTGEPDEPYLGQLLDYIGCDRVLFGTDFPHVDHDEGLVDSALSLQARFGTERLRQYLWDNCARFLGLPS